MKEKERMKEKEHVHSQQAQLHRKNAEHFSSSWVVFSTSYLYLETEKVTKLENIYNINFFKKIV